MIFEISSPWNYQDYKKIILDQMKSVLKPHGFRKTGSMFSSSVSDVLLIVQLQSSRRTTRDILSITVNLAIQSKPLTEEIKPFSKMSLWEAHWRQRIGYLLPQPHDKWWKAQSLGEATRSSQEIADILNSKGLPLLLSLSSTKNLMNLWESGESPGLTDFQREKYLSIAKNIVR